MLDYYDQKQLIAQVDRAGNIIGEIEKWEAHRKGILHKALTVTIFYEDKILVQERKHPAFDKVLDVTSSSHQLFLNNKLQDTQTAAIDCLKREWNLSKDDFLNLKNLGSIYYKADDPNSEFIEHEVCEILTVEIKKMPEPNLDYAYGSTLVTKEELQNKNSEIYSKLAPWVKVMIEENKL